jgi:hypothetical protein
MLMYCYKNERYFLFVELGCKINSIEYISQIDNVYKAIVINYIFVN